MSVVMISTFAVNDAEKFQILEDLGVTEGQVHIQRYKGLGEMNADELWETTMCPNNRVLKKIIIEDGVEADRLFTILMGDVVEDRRKFIVENARLVTDLDL